MASVTPLFISPFEFFIVAKWLNLSNLLGQGVDLISLCTMTQCLLSVNNNSDNLIINGLLGVLCKTKAVQIMFSTYA